MSLYEEPTPFMRQAAADIAKKLEPMVRRELAKAVPPPVVKIKVPLAADAKLVRMARGAADALTRLDGAKYTSEERPARIALERAVRSLRETLRDHGFVEART